MALDKALTDRAQLEFIRARVNLMQSNPFYAHLVMKLHLEWMEDVPGGLSATDGKHILIAPEPFCRLNAEERRTVLVHEVLHCAAGHLFRRGNRDAFKWNLAGDVYIANMLEAERFSLLQIQEEFFRNKLKINRAQYRDMTTDEIYEKLPDPPKSKGKGQGKGSGSGTGHEHWQGGGCYHEAKDVGERSQAEAEWKQNVIEAGQLAGNAPGAWRELVKAAMPRPPFHLKLFEYLSRGLGGDTSWDSLNRRYLWQGLYLPNDTKVVMGEIAIAVDTSGSMDSQTQLREAFGYIRAFREAHPCQLHLIQCDYDAVSEGQYKVYAEHEAVPETFEVVGRGGTSFDPPFKLLREKRIDPKVLIYMTDGYGSCSVPNPGYPVLWVVIKGDRSFKPPFGEVVHVRPE